MIRDHYMEPLSIADFVKIGRKRHKYTQKDLAELAEVGLRFVRDLEQGKKTLRLDKVNQVLRIFNGMVVAMRKPHLQQYNEIKDVLEKERKDREKIIQIRLEMLRVHEEERTPVERTQEERAEEERTPVERAQEEKARLDFQDENSFCI